MDANAQVSLSCSHAYCEACIRNWSLSSSQCPICRRESCRTDDSWILTETPTTSDVCSLFLNLKKMFFFSFLKQDNSRWSRMCTNLWKPCSSCDFQVLCYSLLFWSLCTLFGKDVNMA